ncbi:2-succinyl-6-hydroxy-2, 4-cyclohexadiene-1-carboxylate synthase [Massilia sp. Bi118]|uniref:alpha/beta fold hydrolase n=1 Tax=Massilia sp. Bi118 TaxID=2822346 RepID=UPI001E0312ED|nr:alpha/beta hydrolase [Massilia sp. Bi118]CAH0317217.1 2-succinyl-6-hydroxy-2, 4-cyclohexadiene-1-carboxylate synthase [Massilia sp. Bi118]
MHTSPILASDVWIDHPHGRLFSRVWRHASTGRADSENTPIVLLHDSLGCVDLWRDFPALLAFETGCDVLAYDRLGFGRSDRREGKLPLDFIADEARTYFPVVCEQHKVNRFIAFGHSVGGGMAVHCAAQYPERCEGLITESAQAFIGEETRAGLLEAKGLFEDERALSRLAKYHGDKAAWVLDAWLGTWLAPSFAAWSLRDVLPAVRCPVLAIHGALDEYGSSRHPETIAEHAAGPSRVHILPGTYHVPHKERPGEIAGLVAAFSSR